jgi:steroid delta-isomerase-like uncharacterized protein
MSTPVNAREIASELYRAYNSHDTAAVAQLYAEDASHVDVAHGRPKLGPSEISEGLGKFFHWFPEAAWDVAQIISADSDHVAVTYTLKASLQAAMGPVEAHGQKISLRGVQVLTLRDGKIQRSEDYWDAATFQKQLSFNTKEI